MMREELMKACVRMCARTCVCLMVVSDAPRRCMSMHDNMCECVSVCMGVRGDGRSRGRIIFLHHLYLGTYLSFFTAKLCTTPFTHSPAFIHIYYVKRERGIIVCNFIYSSICTVSRKSIKMGICPFILWYKNTNCNIIVSIHFQYSLPWSYLPI